MMGHDLLYWAWADWGLACIVHIYIKRVTYKMGKNLTMDSYCWKWLTRQTRPLVREGTPKREDSNFQTELISGRKSNSSTPRCTDWLTDRPTVSRNVTSLFLLLLLRGPWIVPHPLPIRYVHFASLLLFHSTTVNYRPSFDSVSN
jgi:hypothetical protein